MMTGIIAIFEMGLALTEKTYLLKPDDRYQENFLTNNVGERDKEMLSMLHNQVDLDVIGRSLRGAALCDELLCRISISGMRYCPPGKSMASDADSRMPNLKNIIPGKAPDTAGPFSDACALESSHASSRHRLLIWPDPNPVDSTVPYQLFSCVLDSGSVACNFEFIR